MLVSMRRVSLSVLLLLVSCSSGTQELEDCHWIGTLNPLTGDLGTVGLPLENAARLAVRDVNEVGQIGGKQLCVATGDTRTNPSRAAAIVDALVERNGIIALNGAAASASTLEAVVAARSYEMAVVSCCSTSPALTDDPQIYRTVPSDALQGVALAELAAQRPAASVAIIYLNDAYGQQLRDRFRLAYGALRSEQAIVAEVPYESSQDSYAQEVQQALAANPDLIVLIAFPIAGAEIIKAWRETRDQQDIEWLGTDGLKDDRFVLLTGDGIPRVQGTAPTQEGPYFDGFRTRYQAAFGGEEPGIFTPNQYDAVILIALAMAAAGNDLTPSRIRELIPAVSSGGTPVHADRLDDALQRAAAGEDIDYVGVSGQVDIDENGDVVSGYQLWNIDEGATEIVDANICYDCTASSTTAVGVTCTSRQCDAAN